jgi:hypothetical protein
MLRWTCPEGNIVSWIDEACQSSLCFKNLAKDFVVFPLTESGLQELVPEDSISV